MVKNIDNSLSHSEHAVLARAVKDLERDSNLEPLRALIGTTRALVVTGLGGEILHVEAIKFNGSEHCVVVKTKGKTEPHFVSVDNINNVFTFLNPGDI